MTARDVELVVPRPPPPPLGRDTDREETHSFMTAATAPPPSGSRSPAVRSTGSFLPPKAVAGKWHSLHPAERLLILEELQASRTTLDEHGTGATNGASAGDGASATAANGGASVLGTARSTMSHQPLGSERILPRDRSAPNGMHGAVSGTHRHQRSQPRSSSRSGTHSASGRQSRQTGSSSGTPGAHHRRLGSSYTQGRATAGGSNHSSRSRSVASSRASYANIHQRGSTPGAKTPNKGGVPPTKSAPALNTMEDVDDLDWVEQSEFDSQGLPYDSYLPPSGWTCKACLNVNSFTFATCKGIPFGDARHVAWMQIGCLHT